MNPAVRATLVGLIIGLGASNFAIVSMIVYLAFASLGALDIITGYSYFLPVALTLGVQAGLLHRISRSYILSAALSFVSTWTGVIGSIFFPVEIEMETVRIVVATVAIGMVFKFVFESSTRTNTPAVLLSCIGMWLVASAFAYTRFFSYEMGRSEHLIAAIGLGLLFQWTLVSALHVARALRYSVGKR